VAPLQQIEFISLSPKVCHARHILSSAKSREDERENGEKIGGSLGQVPGFPFLLALDPALHSDL
jgi:hypothetical protein